MACLKLEESKEGRGVGSACERSPPLQRVSPRCDLATRWTEARDHSPRAQRVSRRDNANVRLFDALLFLCGQWGGEVGAAQRRARGGMCALAYLATALPAGQRGSVRVTDGDIRHGCPSERGGGGRGKAEDEGRAGERVKRSRERGEGGGGLTCVWSGGCVKMKNEKVRVCGRQRIIRTNIAESTVAFKLTGGGRKLSGMRTGGGGGGGDAVGRRERDGIRYGVRLCSSQKLCPCGKSRGQSRSHSGHSRRPPSPPGVSGSAWSHGGGGGGAEAQVPAGCLSLLLLSGGFGEMVFGRASPSKCSWCRDLS